jgi:hypothetical protein
VSPEVGRRPMLAEERAPIWRNGRRVAALLVTRPHASVRGRRPAHFPIEPTGPLG